MPPVVTSKANQICVEKMERFLRKPLEYTEHFRSLHWVVLGASVLLTTGVWYIAKEQAQEKIEQQFNQQADQVVALVKDRMEKYEDALLSGVAAIHSQSHGIDAQEWKRFADTLDIQARYPGLNGIGVIYYITKDKLDAYFARERKLRPNFQVHFDHSYPDYGPDHHPDDAHLSYWITTYIEPVDINSKSLGMDIAHEHNRLEAALKARDTGKPTITAPIKLVQDELKTPGFLFYVPFYQTGAALETTEDRQKNFVGHVYAPFIMSRLMHGTLSKQNRQVNVSIRDGDAVLFNEYDVQAGDYDPSPLFKKTVSVEIYGRLWEFEINSALSFRPLATNNQPIFILISGIIIDLMLFYTFVLLTRSKQHAQEVADKMTQDWRALKGVMENAVEGMARLDTDGRYIYVNEAYARMAGYTPENLQGREWPITVHQDDQSFMLQEYDRMVKDRIKVTPEARGVRKDGSCFHKQLTMIPEYSANGDLVGHYCFMKDIAERKQAEALREELINQLASSNTELERFAYVASHDMQEPLRMVKSFADILAKDYETKLDTTGKEYLRVMVSSVNRMQAMIENLLSYSRLGKHQVNMHQVIGTKDVVQALDDLQETISQSAAKVTYDPLPEMLGDPVTFIRLLQNLILNAIKYQPEGQTAKVHISGEDTGHEWRIDVRDNGIGIDIEFHEKIFEPFRRLHTWDEVKGTGMGLAICKKIVENMGGRIEVQSVVGKGSVFSFTIPKPAVQQEAA